MSYKVLYRKYRPDNFDNLVGQDNITRILKNSIINNKLSHAYIFSGPRGTGKTSSAKIFSKNINCLNPVKGNACNECINCKNYDSVNDIIEIDAASNNGVNEMREITNNVKLKPNLLKYKVYIIDEFHMLSPSAFNALLVTLEEPPSHVIFILATTNIESVPITILSRCQRFDFKKITINNIEKRLKEISEIEEIKIENPAITQIAKISDGGLRDSLSLLDQLSKENGIITEEVVFNHSGNVSEKVIDEILNLMDKNDVSKLDEILNDIFENSIDYKLFIKSLIKGCTRIVKLKVTNNINTRLKIEDYKNLVKELTDFQHKINVNVDVYSVLAVILFSYIKCEETTVVIKKEEANGIVIEDKQEPKKRDIKTEENKSKLNKLKEIRINNCFATANKEEKIKMIPLWQKFIDELDINLKGKLLDTDVAMCSEKIMTISVERKNDIEDLENLYKEIKTLFVEKFKQNKKIVFITKKDWLNLVNQYKIDKNNGIIYNIKDESNYQIEEEIELDDIFETSKIKEG